MSLIESVEKVTSFIDAIGRVPRRSGSLQTFRGQRDSKWDDNPGLLRNGSKLLIHEYNAVRDLHSVHPQEFGQDANMFDRLVRMQHYGLPTRLLDVSSNPLVALFFATEPYGDKSKMIDGRVIIYDIPKVRVKYFDSDSVACVANLANLSEREKDELRSHSHWGVAEFNENPACDRLVQFIRSEKPYFRPVISPDDLRKAFYVIPKMQNRRIIAQHGAFIIFGLDPLRGAPQVKNDQSIIRNWIDIPRAKKASIRRELDALGINRGTLFPELSFAAGEIVRRYSSKSER